MEANPEDAGGDAADADADDTLFDAGAGEVGVVADIRRACHDAMRRDHG